MTISDDETIPHLSLLDTSKDAQLSNESEIDEKPLYNLISGLKKKRSVPRLSFGFLNDKWADEPYKGIDRVEYDYDKDKDFLIFHLLRGGFMICVGENLTYLRPYVNLQILSHIYCYNQNTYRIGENVSKNMPIVHQIYDQRKETSSVSDHLRIHEKRD